jgi:hypothetical protein
MRTMSSNKRTGGTGTPMFCPYGCNDKEGNTGAVQWASPCSSYSTCLACVSAKNPCGYGTDNATGSGTDTVGGLSMRKATQRPRQGGTGQQVAWRNAGGTVLGYTPMQVIIAVGVGVGAYFLYKKYK